MSNSRRRDEIAEGVDISLERARRIFPPALVKSSRFLGVKFGP